MNRRFLPFIALLLVIIGSSAHAQGRNPATAGGATRLVGGGGTPIADTRDQGFEEAYGSPLRSDEWASKSIAFVTPICTVSCGVDPTTGPRNGSTWVWFGGTNVADLAYIEQQLYIPNNTEMWLTYEYWLGALDITSTPSLIVKIDGNVVDTPTLTATSLGYLARSVDISAYGDGALHTLRFSYAQINGTTDTNLSLDDVALFKGEGVPLNDPGFELNNGSWTVLNGTSDKIKLDTVTKTFSYTGTRAFVFKGSAAESSTLKQSYVFLRAVPPAPGRAPSDVSAYVGAFVKSKSSATGKLTLKLFFSDGPTLKAKVNLAGTNPYTWKQSPPKVFDFGLSITKVQVIVTNTSTGGSIHIDDVEIYLLGVYD